MPWGQFYKLICTLTQIICALCPDLRGFLWGKSFTKGANDRVQTIYEIDPWALAGKNIYLIFHPHDDMFVLG